MITMLHYIPTADRIAREASETRDGSFIEPGYDILAAEGAKFLGTLGIDRSGALYEFPDGSLIEVYPDYCYSHGRIN